MKVLNEGVHSGDASGVVPSSFRLLRQLLSRIEDRDTGRILIDGMNVEIPAERPEQAKRAAEVVDTEIFEKFPMVDGLRPMNEDLTELVLNRTWRPALSVTGVGGMPPLESAGNVLRPQTSVKLAAPAADCRWQDLRRTVEGSTAARPAERRAGHPGPGKASTGWNAPAMAPWLTQAIDDASRAFFGKPAMYMGEGGSIPFMGMLGEKFPGAQFMITGVLGPHSNAHGPNEFLHIPMGKKVTACVSKVISEHYAASLRGETSGSPVAADSGTRHGDHGCC